MPEVFRDVIKNIPRLAEAGVYGIVIEGMKFCKGKKGMVKIGGDSCYTLSVLRLHFDEIKLNCHRNGMKFYSGENRLRAMGDSMTCCGTDGLEGFKENDYNLCMLLNGKSPQPTENMRRIGTGGCFQSLNQAAGINKKINNQSFYGLMQEELINKTDYYKKMFGLKE